MNHQPSRGWRRMKGWRIDPQRTALATSAACRTPMPSAAFFVICDNQPCRGRREIDADAPSYRSRRQARAGQACGILDVGASLKLRGNHPESRIICTEGPLPRRSLACATKDHLPWPHDHPPGSREPFFASLQTGVPLLARCAFPKQARSLYEAGCSSEINPSHDPTGLSGS